MPSETATRFMRALQEFERTGQLEPLAAQFGDDAEVTNLALEEPLRGPDGVRRFWRDYRSAFAEIRSTFTHVLDGSDGVTLEWSSEGRLAGGAPLRYRGVSILETAGGRVRRFRTYYDSAAFLAHAASR